MKQRAHVPVFLSTVLIAGCMAGGMVGGLAGCSGNATAPVEDRQARVRSAPPTVVPGSPERYRVNRGDTLYSIAFRYGLDFRGLAAANRIPAPYTIYPGQRLLLGEGRAETIARSAAPQLPRSGNPAAGTAKAAPQPATPQPATPQPATPQPATPQPATASATFVGQPVKQWRWPSSGKVVRGFSATRHKGIDLSGNRGDSVVAVATGKVVYAGTGILGLGELLIVKHNDVYLSAYGHNDRLLVAEGDVVSAGQRIARKGSSGTDTVKLHFEIRKAGKPIDPQRVLPRR